MKKSLIIAVALLLSVCITTASAVEVTRFGPKQYVCEKGKPQFVTDTFPADRGRGWLIVENGDGRGHDAALSAIIFLNGKKVFGSWAFSHHDNHHKARVYLRESNTISVKVRGRPGSYLTIRVVQEVQGVEPPTVQISANPETIAAGGSSTLTWTSTNASSCTIVPGIGAVSPSGSITVSPTATTTYTITANGPGGTATSSAIVTVTSAPPPAPTVSISANPASIQGGESATLTWTSTNATSCTIDQGIGTVNTSGSTTVSPSSTTTYTIIATGPGGTATSSATVTVTPPTTPPPTVSISANPTNISYGESATLTWSSTNAKTVTIDHGIGTVAASGSTTVAPQETTTYTITAINDSGTANASVTITVTNPGPTVSISANPQTITQGESATLSWTSTNAATAVIDQGIGSVPVSGSLAITPSQTLTYTITVQGPGGTAQASVQVTVVTPRPTVTMSADPTTIQVGQSSTLTWNSTYADSATIDQGVGQVSTSGSRTVTPSQTTTYTITVTGPGGTAQASATVSVTAPTQSISITSPSDGATVSGPTVKVEGRIMNPWGNETGVTISGVVASVYGNQFVASHVPVQQGANTITATALDTAGNTVSTSITINAIIPENYIKITADTESGVSPLETTLRIQGSFSFAQDPTLTYTGPAGMEVIESPTPTEYRVRMTATGLYTYIVEAKDQQNNSYSDTVTVMVLNKAELDAMLQAKWGGMMGALASNDVNKAVSYFDDTTRDAYQGIFTALSSYLPQIAQELSDIQFIQMIGASAEYDIRTIRGGTEYSFYLLFVRDQNGLWKISRF
jgi:hypothetical protein